MIVSTKVPLVRKRYVFGKKYRVEISEIIFIVGAAGCFSGAPVGGTNQRLLFYCSCLCQLRDMVDKRFTAWIVVLVVVWWSNFVTALSCSSNRQSRLYCSNMFNNTIHTVSYE